MRLVGIRSGVWRAILKVVLGKAAIVALACNRYSVDGGPGLLSYP